MEFKPGPIEGVIWRPLKKFHDPRGWLCELYRNDDLPAEYIPVMCYVSVTEPGVARGPHEHVDQADYFCFFGPSSFKMYLWDNRPQSKTYGHVETRGGGSFFSGGLPPLSPPRPRPPCWSRLTVNSAPTSSFQAVFCSAVRTSTDFSFISLVSAVILVRASGSLAIDRINSMRSFWYS